MTGYFLKRDAKIHGPLEGSKLVELARAGKLKPSDELASSQEGPWQPAASVSALKAVFDQLAGGAAGPATGQPVRPAETGQWFVNISGFAADRIEGPVSSQRIKDLIDEKQVTPRTQVMHPVETGNEWVLLRKTDLMQHVQQRKEEKRKSKAEAKAERKITPQARAQQEEAERQQLAEIERNKQLAQIREEAATGSGDPGNWQTEVTTDPTDDSTVYRFTLKADSGANSWGHSVYLIIRETSSDIEVYINWGKGTCFADAHARNNVQDVLSRVGKEEAGTMGWRVSNDLAGTFLQGTDITLHCIKNLMAEDDAVFKTTPYHENPITAVFDVRGLRTAMAPYATEMKTFRELPAVADPTWVLGYTLQNAQRYAKTTARQVNSIQGGCLKIVSMIFCIIMSISGVFAGLAFSGSTVVEDDGFEWGALIIAGVFGLGFVTMEIFRRANARKAKELSDQLDAL